MADIVEVAIKRQFSSISLGCGFNYAFVKNCENQNGVIVVCVARRCQPALTEKLSNFHILLVPKVKFGL